MSNEQPHSGSRWEPTDEAVDGADDATERVAPPSGPPDPAGDENHEAMPPRNRRRARVVGGVAGGRLAGGGVGGYASGRAADGPPTGLAGATGEYGHHRGPSDADGGVRGDRDGDGTVGDGSVGTAPGGTGSSGTGTGSTGTST